MWRSLGVVATLVLVSCDRQGSGGLPTTDIVAAERGPAPNLGSSDAIASDDVVDSALIDDVPSSPVDVVDAAASVDACGVIGTVDRLCVRGRMLRVEVALVDTLTFAIS
jgi:hypothetical protein